METFTPSSSFQQRQSLHTAPGSYESLPPLRVSFSSSFDSNDTQSTVHPFFQTAQPPRVSPLDHATNIDNSVSSITSNANRVVRIYNRRWFFLFIFFLLNATMSVVWTGIINVASQVTVFYNSTDFQITQLTNLYYALYVPGTLLSTYLLSEFGVRVTGSVGGILVTAGSWMRVLALDSSRYWLQALASCVIAVGQPCIMNGCSQLSSQWFPENERNVSTMFGETIPAALGGMILGLYVQQANKPLAPADGATSLTDHEYRELSGYFMDIAILISTVTVIYTVVMREKPPTPPSLTSGAHARDKTTFLTTLTMFRDKNFLCLISIINADFGMIAILSGLLYDILDSEQFSQEQIDGLFSGVLGAAILGGVVIAPIADKLTSKDPMYYKRVLITVNIAALGSLIAFICVTKPDSFAMMLTTICLTSFFWTGGVPVSIEAASEIVYPLPEGAATGYLLGVANVFAFTVIMIFYGLKRVFSPISSVWVLVVLQAFSLLCAFLFNGRFRKRQTERRLTLQAASNPYAPQLQRISRAWVDMEEPLLGS